MPEFLSDLVESLSALITVVTAVIVTYIAVQQRKADALRLTLDRYDRRLRVYNAVVGFLSLVLSDLKPQLHQIISFRRDVAEADFLFGSDVAAYIDRIAKEASDLYVATTEYDYGIKFWPEHFDPQRTADAMHARQAWFSDQHETAKAIFEPYLDISGERGPQAHRHAQFASWIQSLSARVMRRTSALFARFKRQGRF